MDRVQFESGRRRGVRHTSLLMLLVGVCLITVSCGRRNTAPEAPPPAPAPAPPDTAPPAAAPTITLNVSPSSIVRGEMATLQWETTDADSVRIEPGVGNVAAMGTRAVSPEASVTYTATATGPGGTATGTVRLTVDVPPPPAPSPITPAPTPSVTDLFRTEVRSIYFDYDRSEIRPDQVSVLQQNARFFQQNAAVNFVIGGHADNRGTQEYNVGLADRRANAVRSFLIEEGIAAARIETVSYGEERPTCQESREECWSQNRRAEFGLR